VPRRNDDATSGRAIQLSPIKYRGSVQNISYSRFPGFSYIGLDEGRAVEATGSESAGKQSACPSEIASAATRRRIARGSSREFIRGYAEFYAARVQKT